MRRVIYDRGWARAGRPSLSPNPGIALGRIVTGCDYIGLPWISVTDVAEIADKSGTNGMQASRTILAQTAQTLSRS